MERGQHPRGPREQIDNKNKRRTLSLAFFTQEPNMPQTAAPNSKADVDRLEAATDQAIAACGGNARDAVKALIVANEFLEAEMKALRAAASDGYARGKFEPAPRDRKDWYD
jgi:hypothetical protein